MWTPTRRVVRYALAWFMLFAMSASALGANRESVPTDEARLYDNPLMHLIVPTGNEPNASADSHAMFNEPSNNLGYAPPAWQSEVDVPSVMRRAVAVVVLVAVVSIACLMAASKLPGRLLKSANAGEMKIVDAAAIAPRCWVHLVRVRDQMLVVGRDASGIKTLTFVPKTFVSNWADLEDVHVGDDQTETAIHER